MVYYFLNYTFCRFRVLFYKNCTFFFSAIVTLLIRLKLFHNLQMCMEYKRIFRLQQILRISSKWYEPRLGHLR